MTFSTTTTDASTRSPKSSAPRLMRFAEKPKSRIEMNAHSIESGITRATRTDAATLRSELAHHRKQDWSALPHGVVHADLFPDNVLLRDGNISGVIDFYYACNFYRIYDLAITVNQWCTLIDGGLSVARSAALLNAYHEHRALDTAERDAWPDMLRYAALRFWISRLKDKLFPKQGLLTTIKDPDAIKVILMHRKDNAAALREQIEQALI